MNNDAKLCENPIADRFWTRQTNYILKAQTDKTTNLKKKYDITRFVLLSRVHTVWIDAIDYGASKPCAGWVLCSLDGPHSTREKWFRDTVRTERGGRTFENTIKMLHSAECLKSLFSSALLWFFVNWLHLLLFISIWQPAGSWGICSLIHWIYWIWTATSK